MKRTPILHPFLFAIYSVAGIYSQNASQVPFHWLFRPLLLCVALSMLSYFLLHRKHGDPDYAGWGTTVFFMWLFSGHVYRLLFDASTFWRTPIGGVIVFLLFTLPLGILASRWAWEKLSSKRAVTLFLNATFSALILFSLWSTASALYQSNDHVQAIREKVSQFDVAISVSSQAQPDIYLIIVDGYGREDFLRQYYDYDNAPLIAFLEAHGFYVADRATSNYPQTELSISSSMNLNYLDEYVNGFGATSDRSPLRELLQHTGLRNVLQEQGYQFVALPSAALFAQLDDADVYYPLTPLNEFEGLVLSSTVVDVAAESWGISLPVQGYRLHRDYILFSLRTLRDVPQTVPGPKFVFAHLLSPHPPFIFDREGNFILPDRPYSTWDASLYPGTSEEYIHGYVDQMAYLNTQLMEVVTAILDTSPKPPIIIIQGDHGPGAYYDTLELDEACLAERYSILNAYYFPDGEYGSLYPSITPVNTFRVILRQYFGADLPVLEDRNYFASWLSPYQFTDVSDKINNACVIPE
jgi:hypothetical protein